MTTLTTYSELKQNIQDFAKRSDILSKLDMFIDMAEQDIRQKVRVKAADTIATGSTSTSDRFMALPSGFLSMRKLQLFITPEYYPLKVFDIGSLRLGSSVSAPTAYAITSQVEFNCISDQVYTIEMQYMKEHTALSSSNTTNDILTNYPLLYLYGALLHFSIWSLDDGGIVKYSQLFEAQVMRANQAERRGRYGPQPAGYIQGMVV